MGNREKVKDSELQGSLSSILDPRLQTWIIFLAQKIINANGPRPLAFNRYPLSRSAFV